MLAARVLLTAREVTKTQPPPPAGYPSHAGNEAHLAAQYALVSKTFQQLFIIIFFQKRNRTKQSERFNAQGHSPPHAHPHVFLSLEGVVAWASWVPVWSAPRERALLLLGEKEAEADTSLKSPRGVFVPREAAAASGVLATAWATSARPRAWHRCAHGSVSEKSFSSLAWCAVNEKN